MDFIERVSGKNGESTVYFVLRVHICTSVETSAARVALINTSHVRVSGTLFPGGALRKKPPYKAISLTNLKLKYICDTPRMNCLLERALCSSWVINHLALLVSLLHQKVECVCLYVLCTTLSRKGPNESVSII